MNIEDVFFDDAAPDDPLEYVEKSPGALFVPLTGLSSDVESVRVGGLSLTRIHPLAWRMIEKNWLVDLYQEFYAARPRYYCAIPVESDEEIVADHDEFLSRALVAVSDLVLAMRLTVPGFVVDPHYSTPVLRIESVNHRVVGRDRYRLYGAVFGSDVVLQPKQRQIGDRMVSYPRRLIPSSGPALHLPDDGVSMVDQTLAHYREYAAGSANPAVEIAIRNLTRGHDVFLTIREQLLCLITALEAVFGGFSRRRGAAQLGRRIAEAYSIFRGEAPDIETAVEQKVRPVRNAVAHGADYRRDLDYEGAAEALRDFLRVGLPPLIQLSTRTAVATLDLATDAGDDRAPSPPVALQRLLDRSQAGDEEARRALAELPERHSTGP